MYVALFGFLLSSIDVHWISLDQMLNIWYNAEPYLDPWKVTLWVWLGTQSNTWCKQILINCVVLQRYYKQGADSGRNGNQEDRGCSCINIPLQQSFWFWPPSGELPGMQRICNHGRSVFLHDWILMVVGHAEWLWWQPPAVYKSGIVPTVHLMLATAPQKGKCIC